MQHNPDEYIQMQLSGPPCGSTPSGGTYYGFDYMEADLWTDAYKPDIWGSWAWRFQGWIYGYGNPAETSHYNGYCSRGATDHYWSQNRYYLSTTSDGF